MKFKEVEKPENYNKSQDNHLMEYVLSTNKVDNDKINSNTIRIDMNVDNFFNLIYITTSLDNFTETFWCRREEFDFLNIALIICNNTNFLFWITSDPSQKEIFPLQEKCILHCIGEAKYNIGISNVSEGSTSLIYNKKPLPQIRGRG